MSQKETLKWFLLKPAENKSRFYFKCIFVSWIKRRESVILNQSHCEMLSNLLNWNRQKLQSWKIKRTHTQFCCSRRSLSSFKCAFYIRDTEQPQTTQSCPLCCLFVAYLCLFVVVLLLFVVIVCLRGWFVSFRIFSRWTVTQTLQQTNENTMCFKSKILNQTSGGGIRQTMWKSHVLRPEAGPDRLLWSRFHVRPYVC